MDRRIAVSKGFLLVIALLIYLDGQGLVLWYLFAMSLHELGHLFAILCLHGRVKMVRLTAIGAEMKLDMTRPLSYKKEMLAILAGPLVSLCAAWGSSQFRWYVFAGVNLSLGAINLLPVSFLDGGRLLSCILNLKWPDKADEAVHWVSVVFSGVLLGLGWTAWRRWGNVTLLLASGWSLFALIKN